MTGDRADREKYTEKKNHINEKKREKLEKGYESAYSLGCRKIFVNYMLKKDSLMKFSEVML